MADTSIIEKIKKLLNLAQSSCEAEASLAMARAQELLAKYNLDYAQVKDAELYGHQQEEKREKTQVNRSAKYQWQVDLWAAIAEANFCWHWVRESTDPILMLIKASDYPVTMAEIMSRLEITECYRAMCNYENIGIVKRHIDNGNIRFSIVEGSEYRMDYHRMKRHMLLGRESNIAAVNV